jgi:hypothetical protein
MILQSTSGPFLQSLQNENGMILYAQFIPRKELHVTSTQRCNLRFLIPQRLSLAGGSFERNEAHTNGWGKADRLSPHRQFAISNTRDALNQVVVMLAHFRFAVHLLILCWWWTVSIEEMTSLLIIKEKWQAKHKMMWNHLAQVKSRVPTNDVNGVLKDIWSKILKLMFRRMTSMAFLKGDLKQMLWCLRAVYVLPCDMQDRSWIFRKYGFTTIFPLVESWKMSIAHDSVISHDICFARMWHAGLILSLPTDVTWKYVSLVFCQPFNHEKCQWRRTLLSPG